jgi:hypothetical protein
MYGHYCIIKYGNVGKELPIQWVSGVLSLEIKQPGCEADHLPLSNAEVKNGGAIFLLPNMSS